MTTMMLQEMHEQPQAIARTAAALDPLRADLRRAGLGRTQVLFAARGSSDNAASYGRYLCELTAGRAAASLSPSVATGYRSRVDLSHALVVCVSQSGRTQEIVDTQRWAASCGAATVAVTNAGTSPLARDATVAMVTDAGEERAVPATKSFTTQLVAMAVLADALGDAPGLDDELRRVPDAIDRLLERRRGVDDAVDELARRARTVVTSRGLASAVASELGLKLEETCLRPVRALSYADLRHGPIAMVDAETTSVVLAAAEGPMLAGIASVVPQLRSLGSTVVVVGGDHRLGRAGDVAVDGPDLPEQSAPIGLAVVGQLLAESLARALGLDPDAPRGLRKVTQTDLRGHGGA